MYTDAIHINIITHLHVLVFVCSRTTLLGSLQDGS